MQTGARASLCVGVLVASLSAGCGSFAERPNTIPLSSPEEASPDPLPPRPHPTADGFLAESTIHDIDEAAARAMYGVTVRDYPGCASVDQLRIVEVPYRDTQGDSKMGQLVVHQALAEEVGNIFEEIYGTGFRIERIERAENVTTLRGENPEVGVAIDNQLMEQNITSAFNCRTVDGSVSYHGADDAAAIDINPRDNPMIIPNPFTTPAAGPFQYWPPSAEGEWDVNPDPAMIISRDYALGARVIEIFASHGWQWGGDWNTLYDGQHFEKAVG